MFLGIIIYEWINWGRRDPCKDDAGDKNAPPIITYKTLTAELFPANLKQNWRLLGAYLKKQVFVTYFA